MKMIYRICCVYPLFTFLCGCGSNVMEIGENTGIVVSAGTGRICYGGCPVNNLQDNLGMRALGKTINIPVSTLNTIEAHKLKTIVDYFLNKGL